MQKLLLLNIHYAPIEGLAISEHSEIVHGKFGVR